MGSEGKQDMGCPCIIPPGCRCLGGQVPTAVAPHHVRLCCASAAPCLTGLALASEQELRASELTAISISAASAHSRQAMIAWHAFMVIGQSP